MDTYLIQQHLSAGVVFLLLAGVLVVSIVTLFSKDLRWAIALFLLAVILTTSENFAVHATFYILRWLFLILITFRLIIRGEKQPHISAIHAMLLLWVGISLLSVFQAPNAFRAASFAIIYLLTFVVFFLLAPVSMRNEQEIRLWLKMFTYLAIFLLAISVGMYVHNPSGYAYATGRMASLFANPAHLAAVMIYASALLLWRGLEMQGHIFRQVMCYLTSFVSVFLLFLTGTRGYLAAFGITAVVLLFRYRMKMVIFILPLLIAGSFYIVPKVLARATTRFVDHITTLHTPSRPLLREQALERIKERPVRGWGLASVPDDTSPVCPGFASFHNSYLDYAVELGIPGFLVVAAFLGFTYIRAARLAMLSARTKYIKDVAWFIFASLTGIYALAFFSGLIAFPAYFYFYWFLFLAVLTEYLCRINAQQGSAMDHFDTDAVPTLTYYPDETN